jgi:hypothetical protein
MLIRKFKYTDFDGNPREEEWAFNLNKAEVIKWLTTSGDYTLDKVLDRLANERNGRKIMDIFDDLIKMSVGRKSLDGRGFEKTDAIRNEFVSTEAYSDLFTELVTDAEKAAAFVNEILPKELADEVRKLTEENPNGFRDEVKEYLPSGVPTNA